MLPPRRLLCSAAAAALLTLSVAPGWSAAADETDGTITVVVERDVDGNGRYDPAVDQPEPGIAITVSDAAGQQMRGSTDERGELVVEPGKLLTGGRYFVVADLPDPDALIPVPEGEGFSPLSTTVDVSGGNQQVRMGVAVRPMPKPEAGTESAPASEPLPAPRREEAPKAVPEPRFAVGDRVWRDKDRQGRQDDGEEPAGRTSVQLLDANGAVIASTTSDKAGRYHFDDLPAGVYSLRFAGLPPGNRLAPPRAGDPDTDSDPDSSGLTPPFELREGAAGVRRAVAGDRVEAEFIHAGLDAGIAPMRYAVVSQVWQDRNRDGIHDAGEPAGRARAVLLTGRGREVATAETDEAGRVLFTGLSAGRYRMHFEGFGDHLRLTTASVGSDPAVDSDPDPRTGRTKEFALGPQATGLVPAGDVGAADADFVDVRHRAGLVGSYRISNRVWGDTDGDGRLSSGESGIAGVRVELIDGAGAVVGVTTTARSGRYTFSSLPAGQYRLRFTEVPRGLHFTTPGAGGDSRSDSDVFADALTAPIQVDADHPVEDAVGAGLTSAASAAPTTAAPTTAAPAPTPAERNQAAVTAETGGAGEAVGAEPPLGATGSTAGAIPAVALGLAAVGAAMALLLRRR